MSLGDIATTAHHPQLTSPETSFGLRIVSVGPFGADPVLSAELTKPLRVGRAADCELSSSDPALSRYHAEFVPTSAEAADVVDLGSQNRTYVNGQPVMRAPLAPGDVVRMGSSLFVLRAAHESFEPANPNGPLVGGTAMAAARRQISLVAPTNLSVLLLGPTGTGKDVTARLIHAASGRDGDFVAVNCGALPEQLVESELFGHVRGAFTDARSSRKGLFAAAHEGTLFLDEVGDLPLAMQVKLLRTLEDGLVRPVGAEAAQHYNVRIIAATNRDLHAAVAANRFRADLLARLAMVEINLPPLAARAEDLPALIKFLARRAGCASIKATVDALEAMALYDWPHNLRELDGLVRTLSLANEDITFDALPARMAQQLLARRKLGVAQREVRLAPSGRKREKTLAMTSPDLTAGSSTALARAAQVGRDELHGALTTAAGNVRQAALLVGISRAHMYRLLTACQLDPANYRKPGTQLEKHRNQGLGNDAHK